MTKKFKFELNKKGVSELLFSEEMNSMLNIYANNISGKSGKGYEGQVVRSGDRLKTLVVAKTKSAKRDNNKNNTLLKVLR
ncbi:hypothetical protein ABGF48_00735 [Helcococcus bovis]|uniref:hypothetical protein n=1 Tax=Helcococcus bovis TaxID=3153252 RepID=UPI0038B721BF